MTEKELFAKYGIELERLRGELATNLIDKGINVSSTATLQELVPQVSNVTGISPYILTSDKITEKTGLSLSHITSYTDDNAVILKGRAFYCADSCSYIDLPNLLELGNEAFAYWNYSSSNVFINIPNIEIIGEYAFKSAYAVHTWFRENGGATFDNVTDICTGAFKSMMSYYISDCTFNFPKVTSLGVEAFRDCFFGNNNTLIFPELRAVPSSAFVSTFGTYFSIYLPKVSTINNWGFGSNYTSGIDVYFSSNTIKKLYSNAFNYGGWGIGIIGQSHADILNTTISVFNQVNNIPNSCFYYYKTYNNQGIEFMSTSTISENAFVSANFTSINFNSNIPITVYSNAFKYISCPINNLVIKAIYSDAFYSASLTSAYIYSTSTISGVIGNNAFRNATYLNTVSGYIKNISSGAFLNCSRLYSLYLNNINSSITTLTVSAYGAFANTPIYNGSGSIYVPASLYETYISATNWATLSNAFVSVPDM